MKKLRSLFTVRKMRTYVLFMAAAIIATAPSSKAAFAAIDQQFFGTNDILFYNPTCSGAGAEGDGTLVDGDNIKKAFFYFIQQHQLTVAQSAGIVGNLMQESGVNPKSVQAGGPGRGIAQWSKGDRWDGPQKNSLKNWAGSKDVLDIKTQLDFMWFEMTKVPGWKLSLEGSKSSQYPSLKAITGNTKNDAIKAGHSFGYLYERFGVSGSRDKYSGQVWGYALGDAKQQKKDWVELLKQSGGGGGGSTGSSTGGGDSSTCATDAIDGTCSGAPSGWVQVTNKVVQIACTEWNKKVNETDGENCDKEGNISRYAKAAGYGHCIHGLNGAWCGMFVGYVYKTAGFPFPSGKVGYVPNLYTYLDSVGARKSPSTIPKPGDVVTYGQHHTGLVVGITGKLITTIEGNTSPDPTDKVNTSKIRTGGLHMHHRAAPGAGQSAWGSYDVLSKKQAK